MRSKSSRSEPKAILSHFSSLTLSRNRRLHRSQNSTPPRQYLQGLIRLVLFVEPEPALTVLAVLEMVLAIVWLPLNVLLWDSAPEGSVALPATTLRVSGISRWDEAAPRGVSALSRRAALWQS